MSDAIPIVSPGEASTVLSGNSGTILLDVRTPSEFSARRAVGARNVPLDTLDTFLGSLPKDAPILVLCEKGGRATIAATKLHAEGFGNASVIEGGTESWVASGLPVEGNDRKVIGIERQVRIGAGLLVLLGIILSVTIHSAFLTFSAFVGAGLVFAGITDWCGMALLLAKAPWNR